MRVDGDCWGWRGVRGASRVSDKRLWVVFVPPGTLVFTHAHMHTHAHAHMHTHAHAHMHTHRISR